MSPLRIETERSFERIGESRSIVETVRKTVIKESTETFTVGPSDAAPILGITKTTLFRRLRNLGLESQIKRRQTAGRLASRILDDDMLLKLAAVGDQVVIRKHHKTGLTELVSDTSKTLLDITWVKVSSTKKSRSRGSSLV